MVEDANYIHGVERASERMQGVSSNWLVYTPRLDKQLPNSPATVPRVSDIPNGDSYREVGHEFFDETQL